MQAAKTCHNRLTNAGVNLQAYTTIANATDVHDLIHALGYKQVNLYGVSYGTRLALTVMHLFPADIRSVVLDSTVPTQLDLFNSEPAVTQHALDVLFEGCAVSQNCSNAYPQLQSLFYQLVLNLNATPISFQDAHAGTVWINGNALVDWVYQAMYVTSLIPLLPEVITQISRGDYSLISQYYSLIINTPGTSNGPSLSDGMYFSVECGEDMAFTSLQKLDNAANVLRPEIRPGILDNLHSVSNSFFYLFPATGHGVLYTATCPDSITEAFLAQPGERPVGSCIAKMQEPDFR